MKRMTKFVLYCGLAMAALGFADAKVLDDGQNVKYYETMKGKKVIFVPQATGIDNVEGYIIAMRKQADALGIRSISEIPTGTRTSAPRRSAPRSMRSLAFSS